MKQPFLRHIQINTNGWVALSLIGAAVVLLPNLHILLNLFHPGNENWQHIQQYVLKDTVLNTLMLLSGTALFSVIIGVTLAWLVVAYDFPLKRFFRWAVILPMAIAPYIGAYTYSGMLSYTGFIQTFLRNTFDVQIPPAYLNIMSIPGAIFIFTLFLYPYVYLITKAFLERQSASLIENARLLGKGSFQIFVQVVLPISRAAIVGGVTLVILEVLNDYGVASYFGIRTFSTAIFQTWFGLYDIDSAIKLSAMLMGGVLLLLLLEKYLRGRRSYGETTSKVRPIAPKRLTGVRSGLAVAFSLIILSLGFLIPFIQLIAWGRLTYAKVLNASFVQLILNTLFVALIAAAIIITLAVIVGNYHRMRRTHVSGLVARIVSLGYSVPGAVISIGVIVFFISLDERLIGLYQWLGYDRTLVLSLSLAMLIFAYVIRFTAIGLNAIEGGFEKSGTRYLEASRMLGYGVTKSFFKIDLPLLKGAILSGTVLIFIDIIKELPLTLLLRPFNFETLSTRTYQFASDERIHEAAIPALIIVGISMISVYLYHHLNEKEGR